MTFNLNRIYPVMFTRSAQYYSFKFLYNACIGIQSCDNLTVFLISKNSNFDNHKGEHNRFIVHLPSPKYH